MIIRSSLVAVVALGWVVSVGAQGAGIAGAAARPAGAVTSDPLRLSIAEAVARGLTHNLAAILQEQEVRSATSDRLQALSALLPHVSANVRESAQVINTAAFGFSGFGGLPNLIGPFTVFDARLVASMPLFDKAALSEWRAKRASADAAAAGYREVREVVVLAVGNLYLEALADSARVSSTTAQVATAEALVRLTADQNASGLAARIDVLRQQVQLESARTQAIAAGNQLAKRKLELARAIGLTAGQPLELTSAVPYAPAPAMTLEAAVAEAADHRDDLKGAHARVDAARASRQAAVAGTWPSLRLDGDVGALGLTPGSAAKTYSVAATVHVPIFDGGTTRAKTLDADAVLRRREAELADLEAGVRFDVAAALLDLQAADAAVGVARSAETFAREALAQAEDRVRAGVATTIELVQAQESVARASEQYIASVYNHNVAKAQLARAMGEGETRFLALVGGRP